jgi:HEAT repeat protein
MKEVIDFASSLQRAVKAFLLYGNATHPRAREATEALIDHTEALLRRDRVGITGSQGSLFVDGQLVTLHHPAVDWLIAQLGDRQISGLVISKGVTAAELSQVVKIFTLKLPQLEQIGGPAKLLADVDASHIRVSHTHYEEVRDGEVVVAKSDVARSGDAGSKGWDPSSVIATLAGGGEIDEGQAAEFAAFVAEWIRQKKGPTGATENSTENPPAATEASMPDILAGIVNSDSTQSARLSARMRELGISHDEVEEILEVVAWENLGIDERVHRSLEGFLVFELPLEKVLSFILELVRSGRPEDASRIVDKISAGLFSQSSEHRKAAADALQRIVPWIIDPGLPRVIEATVEKQLLTHFVKETDPQIQRRSQIALMRLYDTWILRGQLTKALQTLRKLETVASAAASTAPWKPDLFEELLDRLVNEERTTQLLDLLHAQDLETVAREFHPLISFFGGRAAVRLLEQLEVEQDRARRGRLIKAIKAVGKPALQHLESALRSPTWYLVRNALNVLGDLTAVDVIEPMSVCLGHGDERVRRAAARALGKIGGVRVERSLIDALAKNEGETQIEILNTLGVLKAESALEPMIELTKPRRLGRSDDPVRLKAIETVGAVGSTKAVPVLAEMIHRKGVLGGEPPIVRKTICLALIAIGSLDAYKEVQSVAESDPDPALRAELSKALWH